MSYNGWSNYETWCAALWIDNDEGLYNERIEMGEAAWEEYSDAPLDERSVDARIDLAGRLETLMTELSPDMEASLWSDLFLSAFQSIDWHEIADNFLSDTEGYISREKAA